MCYKARNWGVGRGLVLKLNNNKKTEVIVLQIVFYLFWILRNSFILGVTFLFN